MSVPAREPQSERMNPLPTGLRTAWRRDTVSWGRMMHFPEEALYRFVVAEPFRVDEFDDALAVEGGVAGEIDAPHAALG